MGVKMLLLGVYGMKMVECGGALALNAQNGGLSFTSIVLADEESQRDVSRAVEVLCVEKVYFGNFTYGEVDHDHAVR